MSDKKSRTQPPNFLGYKSTGDAFAKKDELKRLNAANEVISVVLGELQYIQELMGLDKIAPVEDIEEKVKRSQKKIQDHLNRYEQGEGLGQEQNQASGPSVPIEQHPFLEDMGGMPLEMDNLDKEFLKELGITETQDKAEMQNQIKNKLKEKLKNTLKFAAKLSVKLQNDLKNQPQYKPALKQANELVIKYKLALESLKNKPILKPEAPAPAPEPRPAPAPRPPGMFGG